MIIFGWILPGLWQVSQTRYLRGLLLFCSFAFFLNAFLMIPFVLSSNLHGLRWLCIFLAVVAWGISSADMYKTLFKKPGPSTEGK